ncbi:MAG: metallophosphoesterase [Alphaproteobacteria bacterium]
MMNRHEQPLFSFAIIADTHITEEERPPIDGSHENSEKISGMYRDLIERVNAMEPAFVVHLGDITHPTPISPEYSEAALAFHKASEVFEMPLYLVPGNHDIGEKLHPALPDIDEKVSITKRAIGQYEQYFGRQFYSFHQNDCLFLVINTMLLNSGLEEERRQWEWLEQILSENTESRKFVFAHYPLYLSSKHEIDHYDNINQPARSELLNLLTKHGVEGYYAGHVHNFFYNNLNGMHQFVLPSTSIIRHDYMEFFRSTPTREMGRFDRAKTGFFWVEVYTEGHVPYLIRTNSNHPFRTHSWCPNGASVTIDLRMPWCDEAEISTPWAVEIFERKIVRNDYPLSALWEMGVTEFRVPISDLLDSRVFARVSELIELGHRFTVVMFGLPNPERQAALLKLGTGVKAIEVVGLFNQWHKFIPPLTELRRTTEFQIYLNPVRPEVEGWTTHHGLNTFLNHEIDWVLSQSDLEGVVDGFVYGIKADMAPLEGFHAVRNSIDGSPFKAILHVSCVGFDRTKAPTDEASRLIELGRVAESILVARANPETPLVIDNFVELDRGYFNCRGLVDRFFNPKDGSRIVAGLNCLLPHQIETLESRVTGGGRVLIAEHRDGVAFLIVANARSGASEVEALLLPESFSQMTGTLIDLTNGNRKKTSLRDEIASRAESGEPVSPVLLTV